MFPRLLIAGAALLGLPGCVAAIPLVAQLATGATSVSQLCGAVRIPGQAASLCDKISLGAGQMFSGQNGTGQNGTAQDGKGQGGPVRTGMADPQTARTTTLR